MDEDGTVPAPGVGALDHGCAVFAAQPGGAPWRSSTGAVNECIGRGRASWLTGSASALHDEQALRERDKTCVYCHKAMKTFPEIKAGRGVREDLATIEHLNFGEPFYVKDGLQIEDIVICCAACNSSRRDRRLWDWFKSAYCAGRNINPDTVAEPVQKYLREFPHDLKQFIESAPWTFAKTFAETWPHEYLVRDRVNEAVFVCLSRHIYRHGYEGRFYEMTYIYFDYGEHTYWNMENVINRCLTSETYDRRTKEGRLPTAEKSSGEDERKVGC